MSEIYISSLKQQNINQVRTLPQEDNLLIQAYITTALLVELHNCKFLESEYYNNLDFEDKNIRGILSLIGIDNQGNLLVTLYTLLVIPKQLLSNEFPDKFSQLNVLIGSIQSKTESNYNSDKSEVDYLRHIRNAVAHARVEFVPGVSVTFLDKRGKNEKCEITIPLNKIGLLLKDLQTLFLTYIQNVQNRLIHLES